MTQMEYNRILEYDKNCFTKTEELVLSFKFQLFGDRPVNYALLAQMVQVSPLTVRYVLIKHGVPRVRKKSFIRSQELLRWLNENNGVLNITEFMNEYPKLFQSKQELIDYTLKDRFVKEKLMSIR